MGAVDEQPPDQLSSPVWEKMGLGQSIFTAMEMDIF